MIYEPKFSQITYLCVLLIFIFSAVALLIGIALYSWLKKSEQGYAYESEIEAALLPIIYNSISSAYKVSELAFDELGERLAGADKNALALAAYDMLPPSIGRFPVGLVKGLISREKFADLVQIAFDEFLEFYDDRHEDYVQLWLEWRASN